MLVIPSELLAFVLILNSVCFCYVKTHTHLYVLLFHGLCFHILMIYCVLPEYVYIYTFLKQNKYFFLRDFFLSIIYLYYPPSVAMRFLPVHCSFM